MRELPKVGEIWMHFKGNSYQIVAVAKDTETENLIVVYRQLVEPYATWARPAEMFMSEVDHEKYPDVKQKYRFVRA